MKPLDFARIWLNRNYFQIPQDFLNERITDVAIRCSLQEVQEMVRVWLVSCHCQKAPTKLCEHPNRFSAIRRVDLSYDRYQFLFKTLGSDLPSVEAEVSRSLKSVRSMCNFPLRMTCPFSFDACLWQVDGGSAAGQKVWGTFTQSSDLLKKIEIHFGDIGKNFAFDGMASLAIDDDKLRHSSKKFRDLGLQLNGFRGSRCGPAMDVMALVHVGIVALVHFRRHGDHALSVVKKLFEHIGHGNDDATLKSSLQCAVHLDRFCDIDTVVRCILSLGGKTRGTCSEKLNSWPFWTKNTADKHAAGKKVANVDGACAAFFARRKVGGVQCGACCCRTGSGGISNILSFNFENGIWDHKTQSQVWKPKHRNAGGVPSDQSGSDSEEQSDADSSTENTQEERGDGNEVLKHWHSIVDEIAAGNAKAPWFECRFGHLTGTTCKNVLRALKFKFAQDPACGSDAVLLCDAFGCHLDKPSVESLQAKKEADLRKSCKALGHTEKTSIATMIETAHQQTPSKLLVFEKIVKSWAMAPTKRKGGGTVENFRKGRLAEPLIRDNTPGFAKKHTMGFVTIETQHEPGLLKSKNMPLAAATPDAIGTIKCRVNEECPPAAKLADCLRQHQNTHSVNADGSVGALFAGEMKAKATVVASARAQQSAQEHLAGQRVAVLDLGLFRDRKLLKDLVDVADCRFQVTHEQVASEAACTVLSVATATIEFILFVCLPANLSRVCKMMLADISTDHLAFVFVPNQPGVFDKSLSRFPTCKNMSWGHAADRNTAICKLQLMMSLLELRKESKEPLPDAESLLPMPVSNWNSNKGPIDDMSFLVTQFVKHFGSIAPACMIAMRTAAAMHHNGFRAFALKNAEKKTLNDDFISWSRHLKNRRCLGGSFEEHLFECFEEHEPVHSDRPQSAAPSAAAIGCAKTAQRAEMPNLDGKATRDAWADNESCVALRLDKSKNHILATISQMFTNGLIKPKARRPKASSEKADGQTPSSRKKAKASAPATLASPSPKISRRPTRRLDTNDGLALLADAVEDGGNTAEDASITDTPQRDEENDDPNLGKGAAAEKTTRKQSGKKTSSKKPAKGKKKAAMPTKPTLLPKNPRRNCILCTHVTMEADKKENWFQSGKASSQMERHTESPLRAFVVEFHFVPKHPLNLANMHI